MCTNSPDLAWLVSLKSAYLNREHPCGLLKPRNRLFRCSLTDGFFAVNALDNFVIVALEGLALGLQCCLDFPELEQSGSHRHPPVVEVLNPCRQFERLGLGLRYFRIRGSNCCRNYDFNLSDVGFHAVVVTSLTQRIWSRPRIARRWRAADAHDDDGTSPKRGLSTLSVLPRAHA